MSIISSRSNRQKQGFTPYQSDQDLNQKEISLLSKLKLNDQIFREQPLKLETSFDKYSCDLRSITSKKRKLSQQFNVNASKVGGKTFLNRSLVGKSSLDRSFINQLQFGYSQDNAIKKELSQNSCPLPINSQAPEYNYYEEEAEIQKPRFTKTKNLLRNLSNYMHKFLLYSKRAENWLKKHFRNKLKGNKRKQSQSVSASNRSSDLGCFQEMCRIQDTVKMEDTPKIQASMMQYNQPSRDDSDHFLNVAKLSLELEERSSPMKDQKQSHKEGIRDQNYLLQQQIDAQIKQFQNWVSQLSIVNFSDYESVWTKSHKFRGLYRIMCYKYYRSEAVCDIYRSRLTTKQISVSFLHQFIEGLLQPSHFYRFK